MDNVPNYEWCVETEDGSLELFETISIAQVASNGGERKLERMSLRHQYTIDQRHEFSGTTHPSVLYRIGDMWAIKNVHGNANGTLAYYCGCETTFAELANRLIDNYLSFKAVGIFPCYPSLFQDLVTPEYRVCGDWNTQTLLTEHGDQLCVYQIHGKSV